MRSVGRLDSPSSLRHDHSTRAPSKDFAHELVKTDDERAREAFDRRQDASASGSLGKAQADATKVSAPAIQESAINHAAQQSIGSSSGVLPSSVQIPVSLGNVISTPTSTPLAGDKGLSASALTAYGDTNEIKGAGLSAVDLDLSSETPDLTVIQAALGQVVQPTGVTEALIGSRIYGVHLLADPYLSELVTLPSEPAEKSEDVAQSMQSTRSVKGSGVDVDPLPAGKGLEIAAPQQEEIVAALTLLADGNESVSVGSSRTIGALSSAAADASTAFWPESSVRLTKQRDGSAVIWLRDYRANSSEASKLVDAMVKGANAKGMRLGRIVLNGREVWTSRNNY